MQRDIKPSSLSKTDVRFWYDRLFKRGDNPNYQVQIGFAGRQERFPLGTPNKDAAALLARNIHDVIRGKGWDAALQQFKPWQNQVQKIDSPTVGDYLAAVEAHAIGFVKDTHIKPIVFKSYTRKFRRLVSLVAGVKADASRFHRGEGSEAWRKVVDRVKLSELTAADINAWKEKYVAKHSANALAQRHAIATVQSIIRNSKALFSKKVLARITEAKVEIELPEPLPFASVVVGAAPKHRYASSIDAEQLARDANTELRTTEPELFKIFLLAFGVGLRRGEIDRLTWPQFNWSRNQINIVVTVHGNTKTDSSIAAVDVDPAVMKIFRKFKDKATGEFVIESTVKPRPGANWHHYRCARRFKRLSAWLRGKGVDAQKPVHAMRKEFGSRICEQFGIFAASEALRHSDIRITRDHYVEKRARIHLEVGKMLK